MPEEMMEQIKFFENPDVMEDELTEEKAEEEMREWGKLMGLDEKDMEPDMDGIGEYDENGGVQSAGDERKIEGTYRQISFDSDLATNGEEIGSDSDEEQEGDEDILELPEKFMVLRADKAGSLDTVLDHYRALEAEGKLPVRIEFLAVGVGNVTPSDIKRAKLAKGEILMFGSLPKKMRQQAQTAGVKISAFDLMSDLLQAFYRP